MPEDRATVTAELLRLRPHFPKLKMPTQLVGVFQNPPASPDECAFAKLTTCVSADFTTQITPCQFGGEPDCLNCGCVASAGLSAVTRHRLPVGVRVGTLLDTSLRVGDRVSGRGRAATPIP